MWMTILETLTPVTWHSCNHMLPIIFTYSIMLQNLKAACVTSTLTNVKTKKCELRDQIDEVKAKNKSKFLLKH